MANDIFEENKELKRTLYTIEKAILEFRLTQLDLPLEKVNVPSVFGRLESTPTGVVTCTCGDECNCEEEKEVLKEQIERLKAELNEAKAEVAVHKRAFKLACDIKKEDLQELSENSVEETEVEVKEETKEEPVKQKRQYKERGGSVFKDFKNLTLENNNFEGNSVIYRNEELQ